MKSLVFSADELYKCSLQSERRNLHLTKELFTEKSKDLIKKLTDGLYDFSFKEKNLFYVNSQLDKFEFFFQNLVLRNIYKNIKTLYKLTQSNRDEIVSQIHTLLKEKNYWILKLDLKSFYESINFCKVIEKLKKTCRLNSQTIFLLEKIFTQLENNVGVPRGISVSAIIAELFMKDFDLNVKRKDGVYYYARFVDDMIIFCSSKETQEKVKKEIEEELKKMGLELNDKKIQIWDNSSTDELTYLGYEFSHNEKKIDISIAEKKIKKIKTRIVKSFINFVKNKNFNLLENRIKFLTGNMTLEKIDLGHVNVGIFYNYKLISEKGKQKLRGLDCFYQKILNCKSGKLGVSLSRRLLYGQKKRLKHYSFLFGFENKVRHSFSFQEMNEIKRCWL